MSKRRILITGMTGFAGSHLTEALLRQGDVELFGVSREGEWTPDAPRQLAQVSLVQADLCDDDKTLHLLRDTKPDQIYHLAGHADVGRSLKAPAEAWRDNFTVTQTLYQAIEQWGGSPRVLYVGSGLVYGEPRQPGQVMTEESALYPLNPYAASKAAADLLSYQYSRHPGLDIVRARPFNHIGPRQSPRFAVAHFAKQIAAIEKGQQQPIIKTGNLHSQRDLSDVRDVVRAYILLMESGQTGEAYNIASEQLHRIEDILNLLIQSAGVEVTIQQDATLTRKVEAPVTRASAEKLRQQTKWSPEFSLDRTLSDTLQYWRENTTKSS